MCPILGRLRPEYHVFLKLLCLAKLQSFGKVNISTIVRFASINDFISWLVKKKRNLIQAICRRLTLQSDGIALGLVIYLQFIRCVRNFGVVPKSVRQLSWDNCYIRWQAAQRRHIQCFTLLSILL